MRAGLRGHPRIGLCVLLLAATTRTLLATDVVRDAQVIGAGGKPMSGAQWTLDATIAQTVVGLHANAGWQLRDGYWHVLAPPGAGDGIFANGFDPATSGAVR
jgi:hypothetical protein